MTVFYEFLFFHSIKYNLEIFSIKNSFLLANISQKSIKMLNCKLKKNNLSIYRQITNNYSLEDIIFIINLV